MMLKFNYSKIVIVLVMLSVLSPYIIGPIKLEQPILFSLTLISLIRCSYYNITIPGKSFIIIYSTFFIVLTFLTFMNIANVDVKMALGAIDRYIKPLMIWLIFSSLHLDKEHQEFYYKALFCVLLISVFITLLQLYPMTKDWIYNILLTRYSTGDASSSTMLSSMRMGRFVSLYDRPSVAGVLFGFYFFWYGYLSYISNKYIYKLGCFLSFLGGLLAASKIFLVYLFLILIIKRSVIYLLSITFFLIAFYIAIVNAELENIFDKSHFMYRPYEYLISLKYLFSFFFDTRFGESGTLQSVFSELKHDSLSILIGQGLGSVDVVDGLFLEIYIGSGILGLILFVLSILFIINYIGISTNKAFCLNAAFVICILAGLGSPTIVVNRFNILLWSTLFMVIYGKHRKYIN